MYTVLMLYDLPLLIVTNVIALAAVLVIWIAHTVRASLRTLLVITILSLVLWQNMIFVADHADRYLLVLNNLLFLWPTVAIASFYGFLHLFDSKHISRKLHGKSSKHLLTAGVVAGVVLQVVALLTGQIFERVTLLGDGTYDFSRGFGYYIYVIGLDLALLCVVVRLLLNVASARKHSRERRALIAVLYTTSIASIYGVIWHVMVPLLTNSQALIGFGMLTVDIFAIGFMVSVMRGRLLDIKLYAVRSVVYVLSLATLVAVYVLVALATSSWFLGQSSLSPAYDAVNIISALLLAFIFQPVKRFFDHITNSLFFRDNYDTSEFYARLSRLLAGTTDLKGLLRQAAEEIASTLKAEYSLFYVYDDARHVLIGTHGSHQHMLVRDARLIGDAVARHGGGVIMADLADDELHDMLVSRGASIVLPLYRGGDNMTGYLLLGDHRSSAYSIRDTRALETVADELALAIQNALSVQEVKELNATLQERIDEATKELRASNSKLQKLDQAKDEFVSMASHQLRTPLTSVKGYISMVLEGDAGEITPMQDKLLSEAFASSERMVHLINDFLNVSRLQTGRFMLDARPTDLAKVVGQEVDSLRSTAQARSLTLQYRAPSRLPILYVDEGKLRQVIMNFLDNAIYYSREHTSIKVKLASEAGEMIMEVHDTGIGVPEAEQVHLFSKFFRATNARKQRPDGTGVGLYLAKKVITAHGGKMIFSSVEGEGSVFGFRLPIANLLEAPASEADDLGNQPNKG